MSPVDLVLALSGALVAGFFVGVRWRVDRQRARVKALWAELGRKAEDHLLSNLEIAEVIEYWVGDPN